MPRYDYHCEKCQKDFRDVTASYEDKVIPCPACENDMLRMATVTSSYIWKCDPSGATTVPKGRGGK